MRWGHISVCPCACVWWVCLYLCECVCVWVCVSVFSSSTKCICVSLWGSVCIASTYIHARCEYTTRIYTHTHIFIHTCCNTPTHTRIQTHVLTQRDTYLYDIWIHSSVSCDQCVSVCLCLYLICIFQCFSVLRCIHCIPQPVHVHSMCGHTITLKESELYGSQASCLRRADSILHSQLLRWFWRLGFLYFIAQCFNREIHA